MIRYHFQQQLQLARLHQTTAGSWRGHELESSSDDELSDDGDASYIDDTDDDIPLIVLPRTFLGATIHHQEVAYAPRTSFPLSINTANYTIRVTHTNNATANTRDGTSANATSSNTRNNNEQVPPLNDANNRPPSPWGSSKAKQRIIDELKDEKSDIHLLIGHYTLTNFDSINFTRIHEKYAANKYKPSRFRENLKLQLKHLLNKTGAFKIEEDIVETWYTSARKVSRAYSLLFSLYIQSSHE